MPEKRTYTITKRYSRKVARDWQSAEAMTELTTTVEVTSGEELLAASEKLFAQAKSLTETDLENAGII